MKKGYIYGVQSNGSRGFVVRYFTSPEKAASCFVSGSDRVLSEKEKNILTNSNNSIYLYPDSNERVLFRCNKREAKEVRLKHLQPYREICC